VNRVQQPRPLEIWPGRSAIRRSTRAWCEAQWMQRRTLGIHPAARLKSVKRVGRGRSSSHVNLSAGQIHRRQSREEDFNRRICALFRDPAETGASMRTT
jgi:hypothetical protein